jgi:hypothetical protein
MKTDWMEQEPDISFPNIPKDWRRGYYLDRFKVGTHVTVRGKGCVGKLDRRPRRKRKK